MTVMQRLFWFIAILGNPAATGLAWFIDDGFWVLEGVVALYTLIGLYDLFLHKQDRAYTIPQLYEFVENAGLNITCFHDSYTRAVLNIESYFLI